MSQMTEELSAELAPPPESKSKQKRAKKDPASQKTPGKRGQPRPYRKLADDILTMRVTKLTARLERAKKQHEDTKRLLTKYSFEKTVRLRDTLASIPSDLAGTDEVASGGQAPASDPA